VSIDLGQILDQVLPLAASAIATSGTTVDLARPAGTIVDGTADPVTLAVTEAPVTVVASGLPAIVTPAGRQTADRPGYPTAPQTTPAAYTVLLDPSVVDVQPGDVLTVTASLDVRLTGRSFVVVDVPDGFHAAVRTLVCEPLP
jgi:flagellar basal body rod protein FlgF